MSRVAFVGCGRMGVHMARYVLDGGHQLTVFDKSPAATAGLAERGAEVAPSAGDAAEGADLVFTSLPDPPVVEAVYLADDGVVSRAKEGAVLVDTSTSAPSLARRIAAAAEEAGAQALDAPVSGGPMGAEAGTLAVMVGGRRAAFEQALPVMELFGSTIRHMGGPGAGQATKLVNNLLAGCYMASISEAVALALRQGIDPNLLFEVLSSGTGNSKVLHTRFPVPGAIAHTPASNGWTAAFPVDLAAKDLDLALAMAEELGVELAMTSTARRRYRTAQERGEGQLDYSVIARQLQGEGA